MEFFVQTSFFIIKENHSLDFIKNTIQFGDQTHSYLGKIWEAQTNTEKRKIILYTKDIDNIFEVFINYCPEMNGGYLRKYIGNGQYELLAQIYLDSDIINRNFYFTTEIFIDLWNLMFEDEKSYYDKEHQRKNFLKIFKKCEIPLYHIDNFITHEIEVEQIQSLKENQINLLIDKIGHQLKFKKYLESIK